jgi:tetratricopeptide (TPR) repeat protein
VTDDTRIEELRRRLQKDPASIAFAQLAEELRRAGRFKESIEACRAGLGKHPGYLSARVTLGRALLEVGELDSAQAELTGVLRTAPENLAAIRGLAEVHRRKGELPEALEQYRAAFDLARNDPGIDQIVRDIRKELEPLTANHVTAPSPAAASRPQAPGLMPTPDPAESSANRRAQRIVQHLERWLEAVLAERRTRLMNA